MTLWSFIKDRMLNHPSQTLCENDAVLTFEEMTVAAESLGEKLKGQICCAVCCRSELFTALGILGCFAAGVPVVPLSFRYGSNRCGKILKSVGPSCVLTDVEGEFGIYDVLDSEYDPPERTPALILYTSGTSGNPKGVMLSGEGILRNVCDILTYLPVTREDSVLIARPLQHSAVLTGEFLVSLVSGAKIVFFSDPFQPKGILDAMQREHITVFCGTPTLLETVSRFARTGETQTVRTLSVSGEPLSRGAADRIRCGFPTAEIHHVYGLTEASPRVSHLPPEAFDCCADCVGLPLPGVGVRIVNRRGRAKKRGETGMLWVRGENVMLGYYGDPKGTAKVLRKGWLCTGDLARITDEGFLQIRGRADDLILRAGMNIYPQEIEGELKKDPRTKEVFVRGVSSEGGGTQIVLTAVGDFRDCEEVRRLCAERLPPYQMPNKIELAESIPKNGTGKIIRRENDA